MKKNPFSLVGISLRNVKKASTPIPHQSTKLLSTPQPHNQSVRQFGHKAKGSSIVFFPHSTYISGGGVHPRLLLPEPAPWRLAFCIRPGAVLDNSTKIHFNVPQDHVEDPELARGVGVYKLLRPNDNNQSFWTVSFVENKSSMTLRNYIEQQTKLFFSTHITGTILPLKFSSDFLQLPPNFKYECWQFNPASTDIRAQLVLFIQTPTGFWQISWHGQAEYLMVNNKSWIDFIKNVKIELNPQFPSNAKTEAGTTVATAEQQQ